MTEEKAGRERAIFHLTQQLEWQIAQLRLVDDEQRALRRILDKVGYERSYIEEAITHLRDEIAKLEKINDEEDST